ncbi:hypothetical protein KIMH_13550 [Bombiscardovia apis]|uniref:CopG family transcriptional regulator n=1 Tax=Bombiscardovia apis TaxID=2932182 RepID=A0ABM8BEC1_9BIFI|nr:hypothetical protein [Bombiscardovia apis]BDR55244.1 hypothetical protein KIMH_13550 [Bombiscardovia apis]
MNRKSETVTLNLLLDADELANTADIAKRSGLSVPSLLSSYLHNLVAGEREPEELVRNREGNNALAESSDERASVGSNPRQQTPYALTIDAADARSAQAYASKLGKTATDLVSDYVHILADKELDSALVVARSPRETNAFLTSILEEEQARV